MEKKYVRMNNSNDELSLGNFTRLVKNYAVYKKMAGQSDIFNIIIGKDVSDSAVNNYCIGLRAIADEYKELFKKRFKNEFPNMILEIYSLLSGNLLYETDELKIKNLINSSELVQKLSYDLYNISKNDKSVNSSFSKKLRGYLDKHDYYDLLKEVIYYIILLKKQPVYSFEENKEMLEELLNDTNISVNELEKFLKLQMQDGINYTFTLRKLAEEGNAYACYEMGEMEYNGYMTGEPRKERAYEFYKTASDNGHPRSCWMIGKMLLNGEIGSKSKEDLDLSFRYLSKARDLGSTAAINSLGLYYLNIVGDEDKALMYFKKAASKDYVYAFNNLGKFYENKGEYDKAFNYYLKSADLNESWACNKVGQYYRKRHDDKRAFEYFNKALNVPIRLLDRYAKFNLAKYYYKDGNYNIGLSRDLPKAIRLFEEANTKESLKELCLIYKDELIRTGDKKFIYRLNEVIYKMKLAGYSNRDIDLLLDGLLDIPYLEKRKMNE